jgi:hypothetical protein
VVEVCPICETVLSENDAFQMPSSVSKQNGDAASLDGWLQEECRATSSTSRRYHDPVVADLYHWTVTGELMRLSQPNWLLEVNYSTESPGIFSIKIIAVEQNSVSRERFDKIESTIIAQGLQPHGSASRSKSWKAGTSKANLTRWGVKQYFTTAHLAPGLLQAATKRLLKVMNKVLLEI